jgi:hypothetical protein
MNLRPATVFPLVLCVSLGFALFKVKYDVQDLEENLVKIHRQTALDQEQIHQLNAEWSYLTQPVRLGEMAGRHLTLQPVTVAQLGGFDTLPLKGDDPNSPSKSQDVPIDDVLKAMQMAAAAPIGPAHGMPIATAKPRAVE